MYAAFGAGDPTEGRVKERAYSDHSLNQTILRDLIRGRQIESQQKLTVKQRCKSGFNYLKSYAGILKRLPDKSVSPRPQQVDE